MTKTDEELLRQAELPPASTSPSWIGSLLAGFNLPFILVLAMTAWSFGGYITMNLGMQSLSDRLNAFDMRLTEVQKQVNQHEVWMRQIQEMQTRDNKVTADLLASINLQLAEIKGQLPLKRAK